MESGSGEEESRWGAGGGLEELGGWWGREVEEGEVEEEAMEGRGGEEGGGVFGGAGGVLGRRLGFVHCSSRARLSWLKSIVPSVSATAAAMTEAGGRGGGGGGGVGRALW